MQFRPKYISFDCYGTLIDYRPNAMAQQLFAGEIANEHMPQFLADFTAYRLDEVLGPWQPLGDVLKNALRRLCRKWKLQYRDARAQAICDAVPTWGPHPDVVAGLTKIVHAIPLVILSNADDKDILSNVARLEVPFHRVYTAEQARAYKPRMRPFEYMLDALGCAPEQMLHVSSSLRYDLMTAHDIGIQDKVWINRGHGPGNPEYGYVEVADAGALAALVGL